MRIALFLLILLQMLVPTNALAQDWAKAKLDKSPRHMDWVTIKAGKRNIKTFIAYPQVKEKATTVVLIHEIFGLTDWVRSVADHLAAEGFIAVAPDLLSGTGRGGGGSETYSGEDAARKAVSDLPPAQVTSDLNAVVNYAKTLPAGNQKIVVGGFCWGGGQAFRFATSNKTVKAAFVFYGPPPATNTMKAISAPIYGFYGENDARITSTVGATKDAMDAQGKLYQSFVYPGAGHGFMRSGEAPDATAADKDARAKAWPEWIKIMRALK